MTITHLSPLNPVNVPAAEGGVTESRSEGMTEASPNVIQQVATQQDSQQQPQNVQPLDLFQPSQQQPAKQTSHADLMDAVAQVQVAAQAFGTQVRFAVNNESHQIIVQVYDVETKEVIREIPPEQIVKVLSKIRDANDAKGILLDEQA